MAKKIRVRGIAVIDKSLDLYGFYEDFSIPEVAQLLEEEVDPKWEEMLMLYSVTHIVLGKRLV